MRALDQHSNAPLLRALLIGTLAIVVFSLHVPYGWSDDTPLPWDESGHLIGALQVTQALTTSDFDALLHSLRATDQYPPGHSLVFGIWMWIFGAQMSAWMTLNLILYALPTALLAARHLGAGLLYVGYGVVGGLAPSLMVEPLASVLLILALLAIPDSRQRRPSILHYAGIALLASALLMTKYNLGLPLLPALALAGLMARNRHLLMGLGGASAIAFATWISFLSWQHDGWASFRSFAVNRANALDSSPIERLLYYLGVFADRFLGSHPIAYALLTALLLALVLAWRSGWKTSPAFIAALAYVVTSLIALSAHPYLLTRNAIGPGVAFAVLFIFMAHASIDKRVRFVSTVVTASLAALVLVGTIEERRRMIGAYFPSASGQLDDVSRFVVDTMASSNPVAVVGTFNEFSTGWIRTLQLRSSVPRTVIVDAPYPLERDRDGLSTDQSPKYDAIVKRWADDRVEAVVAITLLEDSGYQSGDYQRWNAWKKNLYAGLDDSADFAIARQDTLRSGIVLTEFRIAPPPARFRLVSAL